MIIRVVTCRFASFYSIWYSLYGKLWEIIWITFVGNYALRICDFGGRWSVTLKNRGRSKKTEGQTAQKNKDGSLAMDIYLQQRRCITKKHQCSANLQPLCSGAN